ncbi:MAG: NAD-dependent protein deacetylase [Myxococcota bacterium]|nr:NAD-dependent protein deacetylase [Myxococcota bacterium]
MAFWRKTPAFDRKSIHDGAALLAQSRRAVAITGAGISTASGIPDFRSGGGIWDKYDPAEYATIYAFEANPGKVWGLFRELHRATLDVRPNAGHRALANLERQGLLGLIITQNVDGLHQAAGSQRVAEFHGSGRELHCIRCGHREPSDPWKDRVSQGEIPSCRECGFTLKPAFVLFGEDIPADALDQAESAVREADLVMLIGTSAQVAPVSNYPWLAYRRGARIMEMNLEKTSLTDTISHVFIRGDVSLTLPALAAEAIRCKTAGA